MSSSATSPIIKTALITGANKGIGAEIAKGLLQTKQFRVILACRDEEQGKKKAAELVSQTGVPETNVMLLANFDLTKQESLQNAAAIVAKTSGGDKCLDVLINNAGFAFGMDAKESKFVQAKSTIAVNYFGTKAVSNLFIPLVKDGGRVINVCSRIGLISYLKDAELTDLFTNAPTKLTVDKLDELMNKYIALTETNQQGSEGFPDSTYSMSKIGENALTRLQAADPENTKRNLKINAMCPGFCKTDMTGWSEHAQRSAADGAKVGIWLAVDEAAEKLNGEFVADDNQVISFVDGKPKQ